MRDLKERRIPDHPQDHDDTDRLRRQYVDDAVKHPPAEASNGRAATRRRAQVAARNARRIAL